MQQEENVYWNVEFILQLQHRSVIEVVNKRDPWQDYDNKQSKGRKKEKPHETIRRTHEENESKWGKKKSEAKKNKYHSIKASDLMKILRGACGSTSNALKREQPNWGNEEIDQVLGLVELGFNGGGTKSKQTP